MNAFNNSKAGAKSNHPPIQPSIALTIVVCLLCAFGLQTARGATDYSACFIPGETAEYKASWMGLPIAWSKATTDTVEHNGRELIRIRMVSKSYKTYAHIYKVDDVTEVLIDPKTALPVRVDLQINEGPLFKSHLTTFYHDQKVAIFQDRISKDIREVPIEKTTQDLFSFIYSSRRRNLKTLAGQTHKLLVDGKIYELGLKLHKEDRIKLSEYGKVECFEFEPIAAFDGFFLRKGKVMFWISKQSPRMVTCIQAKITVGKVNVKLEKVSGSGDSFWEKIEEK
ncbi:DUF3108 domain-containing protein [Pontiella sulfatireligans]|nr:DUF3108 domain-containing protein [Pontiella sulfatireligans]